MRFKSLNSRSSGVQHSVQRIEKGMHFLNRTKTREGKGTRIVGMD